jgi:hypothetical protein
MCNIFLIDVCSYCCAHTVLKAKSLIFTSDSIPVHACAKRNAKNVFNLEWQFYVVLADFRNNLYVLRCVLIIIVIITVFSQASIGTNTLAITHFSAPSFTYYVCRNSTRHKPFGAYATPSPVSWYWLQIGLSTVSLAVLFAAVLYALASLNDIKP